MIIFQTLKGANKVGIRTEKMDAAIQVINLDCPTLKRTQKFFNNEYRELLNNEGLEKNIEDVELIKGENRIGIKIYDYLEAMMLKSATLE